MPPPLPPHLRPAPPARDEPETAAPMFATYGTAARVVLSVVFAVLGLAFGGFGFFFLAFFVLRLIAVVAGEAVMHLMWLAIPLTPILAIVFAVVGGCLPWFPLPRWLRRRRYADVGPSGRPRA